MKRNLMKCCALLLATAMTLTACGGSGGDGGGSGADASGGGNQGSGAAGTTVNKDAVWKPEEMKIDADLNMEEVGGGMTFVNDTLYLFGESMAEDGDNAQSEPFMIRCKTDGSDAERVALAPAGQSAWYAYYTVGEDGSVYALKTAYPEGMYEGAMGPDGAMPFDAPVTEVTDGEVVFEEAPAAEEPATEGDTTEDAAEEDAAGEPAAEEVPDDIIFDGGAMETYYLVKFDTDGTVAYETQIEPGKKISETDWYGVNGMKYSHGKLVVCDTQGVALFSAEDGSRLKTVLETENYPSLSLSKNGDVYVSYWDGEGPVFLPVDAEAEKTGEPVTLPGSMMMYDTGNMNPGIDSDFIVTDSTGVNSWNMGDDAPVQLLSYIDSDLDIDYFESIAQVSATELVGTYYTADDGRVIGRFVKVDPADVKDREVLSLACNYLDRDLRRAVVHFNRTNADYRIAVHDYSKYNTEENWDEGYKQLNNDIISGNSPDIMALDSGRFTRIYQMKGLLEPLDPYMESDPEISANEYMDSVLDVYRYQGNLCLLTPAFMMRTYAVKASDAAQISEWSLETLQRMTEERGIDYKMLFGDWPMSRENMLTMALVFDSKNYFDWDAHLVKFDSKDFIDLLNFAKKFPEEIDFNNAMYEDTSGYFRTGQALVAQAFFGGFGDFKRLKYGSFGEDIAFVGFPREGGKGGSSVMAVTQFAMSSESKNKDACWQFLRTFLTDEYQQSVIDEMGYVFPVSKKHLEQMAEKAMERESYTDENGETQYFDESYWINGEEVTLPPLTQEDIDQVMELFDTVDSAYEYDETLMNMVQEETAPFFKGQKTAEECAKILQSKAQIYIDENS